MDFSWNLDAVDWITNKLPFDIFLLVIKYPGGNPLVHYETQNEHKTLYMENYDPAGTYAAQVSAVGDDGQVLCWDQISFTKDEFTPQLHQGSADEEPARQSTPCLAGRCP